MNEYRIKIYNDKKGVSPSSIIVEGFIAETKEEAQEYGQEMAMDIWSYDAENQISVGVIWQRSLKSAQEIALEKQKETLVKALAAVNEELEEVRKYGPR
jgi:hypothetical protein